MWKADHIPGAKHMGLWDRIPALKSNLKPPRLYYNSILVRPLWPLSWLTSGVGAHLRFAGVLIQREPPSLLPVLQLLNIWVFSPPEEKGSPPRDKNNHSHITIIPSVERADFCSSVWFEIRRLQCVEGIQKILISVFLSTVGGTAPLICSFALLHHGVSIKATQGGKETGTWYRLIWVPSQGCPRAVWHPSPSQPSAIPPCDGSRRVQLSHVKADVRGSGEGDTVLLSASFQ